MVAKVSCRNGLFQPGRLHRGYCRWSLKWTAMARLSMPSIAVLTRMALAPGAAAAGGRAIDGGGACEAYARDERGISNVTIARATMEDCEVLRDCRCLLHDRGTKFTRSFRAIPFSGWVEPLAPPAPSLNLHATRNVGSGRSGGVLVEGDSVRRRLVAVALSEYIADFHTERNPCG